MKRSRVLLAMAPLALPLLLSQALRAAPTQPTPRSPAPRPTAALRLATLAERVAKLDAQIGLGILAQRSRRAMAETLQEFEVAHRSLLAAATPPEAREALQLLALQWQDYRAWASRPPGRDAARKLGERTEELVWVATKVARQLQLAPPSASVLLAFRAAEACTLSQRVPRLHLWRRWGLRDEKLLNDLRLSEAQLHGTIESLRTAPGNSPEVIAQLQIAEGQAAFLADASRQLDGGKDAARHLEFVSKSGDHILESLERVVRLYEAG